ncbi:hypothetical protein N7541_008333 [Penicillium brevicompactum]|uniref:Immunoglobulin variable region used by the itc63b heavy chain n=1 Tax=Penicillium brevicompactum TaxID=5074 RepID=A0A9W9UQ37_PENBR|nr:hypothetical protein N7541_008333 [Penicillium brevicompactum]
MEALPESLRPPQLFSLVANDVAQPNKEELNEALTKSRNYWHLLGSVAHAIRDTGLLVEYTDPRLSLRRVPKLHARPEESHTQPLLYSRRNMILKASSVWKVTGHEDCDGLKEEVIRPSYMKLASGNCVPVELDGEVFSTWIGTKEEASTNSNYISILTLGWCYILSARLIELRGAGATLSYTDSETQFESDNTVESPTSTCVVDLGEVDDDIVRWWSAILAPNQGWKAILLNEDYEDSHKHIAPWSISRQCATFFSIKHKKPDSNVVSTPMSAQRAFEALSEFALSHELGSQFPISLATALMIPLQNYWQRTAHLPAPITKERQAKSCLSIDSMPQSWKRYMEDIDYYMTLSCHVEMMYAAICGAFWEPDVPCNLASPWLHPVFNEVITRSPEISACDQEILGLICAIRRPSIGALCIGAVIIGLGQRILESSAGGNPPVNQNAYPWTGSIHCFMDLPGTGPYTCEDGDSFSRQDTWRLLHLQTTNLDDLDYEVRPFAAWAPCGVSPMKNCDLQVVRHLKCPRHEYQYDHWTWITEDGTTIDDYGASRELSTPMPGAISEILNTMNHRSFELKELDPEQLASDEATWQAFNWYLNSGNGVPQENAWHDEWVSHLWDPRWKQESSVPYPSKEDEDKRMKYDSERQAQVQSWVESVEV